MWRRLSLAAAAPWRPTFAAGRNSLRRRCSLAQLSLEPRARDIAGRQRELLIRLGHKLTTVNAEPSDVAEIQAAIRHLDGIFMVHAAPRTRIDPLHIPFQAAVLAIRPPIN